jgi:hypothetical protein
VGFPENNDGNIADTLGQRRARDHTIPREENCLKMFSLDKEAPCPETPKKNCHTSCEKRKTRLPKILRAVFPSTPMRPILPPADYLLHPQSLQSLNSPKVGSPLE